ncbi:DUF1289 domain-containing protein [Alphaproteobacteria bacterium GH1-50]|uniref:DUF1289 domain-containing protein n=1 Tax=Kangsaoukella pontilimi TaxID=2691042 RepID=A0A7C9IPP2_9RHOB|nr:DUF1289 domain-containing protein [Kangsaoukella pontilimi]MXQ06983.1 DUF1289 domain-containing protein [Kangsaoukella pontilimi]
MTDTVWRRNEIESPCIRVCVLNPDTRLCLGCHRTADEIAGWSRMSPEARRDIIEALPERAKSQPRTRKGGRAARLARRTS